MRLKISYVNREMKTKELIKEIKDVFKPPEKKYYFGKIRYYTPYFYPINFNPRIIKIRKLKLKSKERLEEYSLRFPHLKNTPNGMFENIPMVRRAKDYIKKIFGNYYFIEIGYPLAIRNVQLGWKWKYDSIRYEWFPMFQIWMFKWQFVISWRAPLLEGDKYPDDDKYYEQILHYIHKAGKDINKAEETWGWQTMEGISTWNKNYLL